jgi:ABC-type sugar transport system ATPase subunit
VLKDGRWQGTLAIAEASPEELVRRVVGRDLPPLPPRHAQGAATSPKPGRLPDEPPPVLEVRQMADEPSDPTAVLRGVSFFFRSGEVVTLAGLAGAGRTEAALSIFGARPFGGGAVLIDGRPTKIRHVWQAIAKGIGYLPEDRKEAGLFLDMSIAQNIAAAGLRRFGAVLTSGGRMRNAAEDYRRRLNIACRGVQQHVRTLSGGNQQKVLLAKWLLVNPRVLIVDEPTRGVDVGAKAEVHRLLVELAERGAAVLVISSDLVEVLTLGDRILVMAQGRITGELSRAEATEERIVHLASAGDRKVAPLTP